jgi:hypothetical protein
LHCLSMTLGHPPRKLVYGLLIAYLPNPDLCFSESMFADVATDSWPPRLCQMTAQWQIEVRVNRRMPQTSNYWITNQGLMKLFCCYAGISISNQSWYITCQGHSFNASRSSVLYWICSKC